MILKSQWETIRLLVDDERKLQEKFLRILDDLIASDLNIPRRLLTQYAININVNYLDVRNLKRAARKFLKQYQFDLHEFPHLALQEKISFLKTLFVRKYLDRQINDDDQQSWNEQIQVEFTRRFFSKISVKLGFGVGISGKQSRCANETC